MAWHHHQLVMLARMVLQARWENSASIEVRIIALMQRVGMSRSQVWEHIARLANGER